MTEDNPYAQMDDAELEAAKNELVAKIRAIDLRIEFVASKMGKLFVVVKVAEKMLAVLLQRTKERDSQRI